MGLTWRLVRARAVPAFALIVVAMGSLLAGYAVTDPAYLRLIVGMVGAALVAVLAAQLPTGVVLGLLVTWMTGLGLIRRLVSAVSPKQALGDPLLLLGAAVWIVLSLLAVRRGALRDRTPLTGWVLALTGLLAVSALNPLQGGLLVGLSGALLVVVPMLAFLVGRTLVDDRLLSRLLGLVAGLGLVVACYGLVQTFVGFPGWDQAWINTDGYTALNVGGTIRAFASFSAASEYVGFLALAVVAWVARAQGLLRWPLVAAAIALLGVALWYASSRGIIVLTVIAVGVMLAARARVPLGGAVIAGVVLLAAMPTLISGLAPGQVADNPQGQLVAHQVSGLTDPFGAQSTLPAHISLVTEGIYRGVTNPLGYGVGSITISGGKYDGVVGPAEADPGRAPFAVGILGLIAYFAIVILGLTRAYRVAVTRRDPVSLAALGILLVTFLQWLNGGNYAVVFWAWLALGWVDARAEGSPTTAQRSNRRWISADAPPRVRQRAAAVHRQAAAARE